MAGVFGMEMLFNDHMSCMWSFSFKTTHDVSLTNTDKGRMTALP